jgi:putative transposase
VLNRGIERRTIFPTRRCNERFIELLSSLPERFGVQLHAYALMGNHYHLGWKAERQTSAKPCTG